MRLGAQFYSIRNHTQTPDGVEDAFREMKEIGYQTVQLSAICQMDAGELKRISEKYALPIVTTHTPAARILNETDAVIAEHKLFGCPEIGIGSMPPEYHGSVEGVRNFIKDFTPAMKKIRAAGLRFAYHNHAFEFDDLGGTNAYEILITEMPDLFFIVDTYWLRYAGQDIEKTIGSFPYTSRIWQVSLRERSAPAVTA